MWVAYNIHSVLYPVFSVPVISSRTFLPSGFVHIVPAITSCMCGASFSVRTRSTLPLWKILCLYPLFVFTATKLCGFISRPGRVWYGMEIDVRLVYECMRIMFACSLFLYIYGIRGMYTCGDRGSTVVKMLCYKSEGRWFDSSCCRWTFH